MHRECVNKNSACFCYFYSFMMLLVKSMLIGSSASHFWK